MIKYPEKIEQWLLLYLQGCLNEEQKQELEAWAKESPANKEVLRKLQEKHWQEGVRQIAYFDQQQNWPKVVRQIARHRRIVWMRRISVAACIAVLLGTSYLLLTPESTPAPPATITRVQPHEVTLSTASGKSYSLDSVGRITTEGTLLKSNGEKLQFKPRQETAVQIEWNTVKVPRGATYKVELSDQTEVTLNAESVLYFPNRFEEGKNREIWLAGEGNP